MSSVGGASGSGSLSIFSRGGSIGSANPFSEENLALFKNARAMGNLVASLSFLVDYNILESTFLILSVVILMAGMVFVSNGFAPDSTGYAILTYTIAVLMIVSTSSFAALLVFEGYRSIRYTFLRKAAREAEVASIESRLVKRHRRIKRQTSSGRYIDVGFATTWRRRLSRRLSQAGVGGPDGATGDGVVTGSSWRRRLSRRLSRAASGFDMGQGMAGNGAG